MNVLEAKRILIACRLGSDDLRSPGAQAALELAQRDAELRQWWEEQQVFQRNALAAFSEVPVPAHLRTRILARAKVVEFPWWRRRVVWSAAAAAIALLIALALWPRPANEDSFATFRSRVVRTVLRQYRMDIMTKDMAQIRQFLAAREAPANYILPRSLEPFPAMGAGVLSWQDRKVSMLCLDAGERGPLFLFIVDRQSVPAAPARRDTAAIKEMNTVSWTEGENAYVLATHGEATWLDIVP